MPIKTFISILFYTLIAAVTIVMAYQIKQERRGLKNISCKNTLNCRRVDFYNRIWLRGIFAILFLCSAFRFNIGNDYSQYVQTAHEAYVGGYVVTEIGFNYFVKLIYTIFGCECYELIFAAFAAVTIWIFIKALYEQSTNFFFAFFFFMTFGLYFQTFNTMRYYLALAIALFSLRYVLQKDWIKFTTVILFAALFHKSVLLVIPVYIIARFFWKKWQILVLVIGSVLCWFSKEFLLKLALKLYPSYQNTIYLSGSEISKVSILKCVMVLGLYIVLCYRYREEFANDTELRFYAQLNILSLMVCIFFTFLPVVTRISYYFSISQILMLPRLLTKIPEKKISKKVTCLVLIASVVYFAAFLYTAGQPGVGLLPYRSWLFESQRYTF